MKNKKGCKSRNPPKDLTKTEKEVLFLFTEEFLTEKQVAIRRQTSQQSVNKIKKKLINKGVMSPNFSKVVKTDPTLHNPKEINNQIRLHGEHFVLNIIWKDKRYKDKIGGIVDIDGHSIKLHNNNVEVYSNVSFFGETPSVCDSKALKYWGALFNKLQDKFKIILVKRGSENIFRVRAEYAEVGNELAKKCLNESQKIRVTGDDGKIWLIVDNSFNFNELETTHPKRSKFDMEAVVQPFFNDLRDNELVTISEVKKLIFALAKENNETAQGLNAVVKLLGMNNNQEVKEEESKIRPYYVG